MNSQWQEFLRTRNARIDDAGVTDFGDPDTERKAACEGHIVSDLSHYGLIEAQGEEAMDFLQNQFSNDVRQVSDTQSQFNSYCNAKGRMLASFQLFMRNDTYYLRLPASILPQTLKRLSMFVLRARVTLTDASDKLARIGLAGPNAASILAELLEKVPGQLNRVSQTDGLTVIRLPGTDTLGRFEIHGEAEAVQLLWQRLARQATPAGMSSWNLLTILSGVPEIQPQTIEAFVPQMVNLTALDGVSFKKGCYPGQEVVARMHYLGKLKRRMYLLEAETSDVPAPGENIHAAGEDQGVGKVVAAEPNLAGKVSLLAVLQIAAAEGNALRLGKPDGPALSLQVLPYTVTNEA